MNRKSRFTSEDMQRALGGARRLPTDLDLARMVPRPAIVSTGFALYDRDSVALVYQPYEDGMCLDSGRSLEGAAMEWRDLVDSKRVAGRIRPTGGSAGLTYPPSPGPAVALVTLDGADGGAW